MLLNILAGIYYVLSYIETIPQIVKLYKTKSSNDISLLKLLIQFISSCSWTLYIFLSSQSMLVYIGSITDMISLLTVDFLVLKYYDFKKGKGLNE